MFGSRVGFWKPDELLAEDQWAGLLPFYTVKRAPYGLCSKRQCQPRLGLSRRAIIMTCCGRKEKKLSYGSD